MVWKKWMPCLKRRWRVSDLDFSLACLSRWLVCSVVGTGVCAKPSRPGQKGVAANDEKNLSTVQQLTSTLKWSIQKNGLAQWRIYIHISVVLSLSLAICLYIYVYMYIDLLIVPSKKEPCNDLFSRANQFFSNAGMLNVSPAVPIGFRVFREWDHSLTFWVPWVGWSCRKPGLLL